MEKFYFICYLTTNLCQISTKQNHQKALSIQKGGAFISSHNISVDVLNKPKFRLDKTNRMRNMRHLKSIVPNSKEYVTLPISIEPDSAQQQTYSTLLWETTFMLDYYYFKDD